MRLFIFVLLLLMSFAQAQNKLYVRVAQNSMSLLGYGGNAFLYDHIFLLPDGTAVRFDNTSEGSEQALPSGIDLAKAAASELVSAGGVEGTYQDDGTTVQTSFDVSFASAGEKYAADESNCYMFISVLPTTYVTGEYQNRSTFTAGDPNLDTQVMSAFRDKYNFYANGYFDNETSSATTSQVPYTTSENATASTGSYVFEGYNVLLTNSDGSQTLYPAYFYPAYLPFEDQVLVMDNSEYAPKDDSALPFNQLPTDLANTPQPQNDATNPLTQSKNPLLQPTEPQPTEPQPTEETPSESMTNTLSGTVTPPDGITLESAFISLCPYDMADNSDCVTAMLDASGSYSLELPGAGEYILLAAMDADGNGELGNGDYAASTTLDITGEEAQTLDLSLEPYTQ